MKGRCPICGKSYEIAALDDLPTFPFCSARCRLIDLARWADGAYVMPGPGTPLPDQGDSEGDEAD